MGTEMNLMTISVGNFKQLIKEHLEDGDYSPVIGIGKAGVGKTVCVAELAKELGIGFKEMRLVTMSELDIMGLPETIELELKDKDGNTILDEHGKPKTRKATTYAANKLLPMEGVDPEVGILVLDEITSASRMVRAASYQLMDSKRALGEYKLPPKWKVIALGNGVDDGGVFEGMESAFLSRCCAYRVEASAEGFVNWGREHNLNPTVMAYVQNDPSSVHRFYQDEDAMVEAAVFPCPRSWEALAHKLDKREGRDENGNAKRILDGKDATFYASGFIGYEEAIKFGVFYAYNNKLVDVSKILDGSLKGSQMKGVENEVMYLTLENITKSLKSVLSQGKMPNNDYTDKCYEIVANVCNWVIDLDGVRTDFTMICLNDIATSVEDFVNIAVTDKFNDVCPAFLDYCTANSIVFGSMA